MRAPAQAVNLDTRVTRANRKAQAPPIAITAPVVMANSVFVAPLGITVLYTNIVNSEITSASRLAMRLTKSTPPSSRRASTIKRFSQPACGASSGLESPSGLTNNKVSPLRGEGAEWTVLPSCHHSWLLLRPR